MLHVMLIYFLVNPAILILHAKFRVCLQYKQTIITSLIPAILSVVISLLATIMTDKNKLQARVIGYYGVWIVFAVVLYIYVLYKGKSVKIEYIKFAVPVSIPLVVHALANTLLSSSDRIMIQKICGPEYTAYYSIAYSCALVVSILWSAISQAWTPWCCEMMHQKMYATIRKVIRPVLLLFSAGVLMLIMIAPEILYILGGEEYMQAVYVIPPVMIGYIAQMLYTLYVNIEYYNRKQKQIMAGTLIAAAINIILNLIFIPIFGYIAAAYTTLVGYIVLLFVHYAFVRHMKLESIYDMKFNISLLLYAMACGIGISLLYNRVVIRWIMISIIICVFVIIVASKKNQIYKAIKEKDYIEMLKILHLMERE